MFIYIIRAVAVVVGVAVVAVIVITALGGNTWQFLCFHSLNVVRVHHHANVVNDTIHPPLSHSNAAPMPHKISQRQISNKQIYHQKQKQNEATRKHTNASQVCQWNCISHEITRFI